MLELFMGFRLELLDYFLKNSLRIGFCYLNVGFQIFGKISIFCISP
jgi:hypothetical protein